MACNGFARRVQALGGRRSLFGYECAGAQRRQVQHPQAPVLDANRFLQFEVGQGLVHALARQANQVSELLLGDTQDFTNSGIQHGVEQRRQAARHANIGVGHAVNLARGNELPQPLIELVHHKAVETYRVVQQPVKGIDRQPRDHTFAQGLDVVAVRLAFERRAFAKPAAWRHPGKRHGHALGVVAAHLEQALHHTKPVSHRPA